ncbi:MULTISPECIES: hypothetical protein, partial [Maribacter]
MNGNSTTTVFARCSGPIIPKKNINDNIPVGNGGNGVQTISYGEITFECGSQFTLDNILLVWTVPSDPDCPIPASDPPPPSKCGAPGISLEITPPLSAVATAECSGSDANVDLTIVGGEAPYSYTWTSLDSGFTSSEEDPQNVPQGEILSVTVTDSDGCTTTTSITTPICFVCPTLTNETADFATCEDNQGQTLSVQTDIAEIDIEFFIFSSQQGDPYVGGGSQLGTAVTPSGGTATSSTGISGLTPGTYYAYAILDTDDPDLTDPDCRPFAEIVIQIDPVADAGDDNATSVCDGTVVDLTTLVSVPGGSFSDASGDIPSSFDTTGLSPGSYDITYTVGSGNDSCPADTATITVNVDTLADAGDDNATSVCDGTVVDLTTLVSVPGGSFSDASGDIPSSFDTTGLSPGSYDITYTVGSGNDSCPADTATITVTVNPLPDIPEIKIENATCDIEGSAVITNYMEGLEYTFLPTGPMVDGTGSITGFILDTAYSVIVKDLNSDCESESTVFSVGSWEEMTCSITQDVLATDHITPDGVATVHPVGGSGHYTYLWDNGETGQTATTLTYGIHTVTVTDANGCETTCQIDIAKELYCWTNLISNVSYAGGSDGSARVRGNGGYRPYTFRWEDGSTGEVNDHLSAGTHYVTITDATGATSQCSVTISEPNEGNCTDLTCSVDQDVLATDHITPDGVAMVHPIGGSGHYTYLWDNGETGQTAT